MTVRHLMWVWSTRHHHPEKLPNSTVLCVHCIPVELVLDDVAIDFFKLADLPSDLFLLENNPCTVLKLAIHFQKATNSDN